MGVKMPRFIEVTDKFNRDCYLAIDKIIGIIDYEEQDKVVGSIICLGPGIEDVWHVKETKEEVMRKISSMTIK